jgi:hypothetical protein
MVMMSTALDPFPYLLFQLALHRPDIKDTEGLDRELDQEYCHAIRDIVYGEDHEQAWAGEGPQALVSLRNLAIGLFRMKNTDSIKETTEWVCRDRTRALQFMTA